MTWLLNNISSIIVFAVLVAIIALITAHMIKNKKQGKTSCGCGCADCAMKGTCHSKK